MEDRQIIDLYFQRSEGAISATRDKYGHLLCSIALGILKNMQDAEECESDTYLKTWNVIPPTVPNVLSAFLSKIVRNLSLDRYEHITAEKRGGGEIPVLLDELEECIPDPHGTGGSVQAEILADLLNEFLGSLKKDARIFFMRRYWYGDSVEEISRKYNCGESRVKMSLMRSRNTLKAFLEKAGYTI